MNPSTRRKRARKGAKAYLLRRQLGAVVLSMVRTKGQITANIEYLQHLTLTYNRLQKRARKLGIKVEKSNSWYLVDK